MKEKKCHKCFTIKNTLFRVKIDRSKNWYFLCRTCTEKEILKNENYIYGGTWKR